MKSGGFRSGTRKKFKKDIRKAGMPSLSKYLTVFKNGDYVDINIDSAVNKSMPHKTYQGRTGRVFKVNTRSVGVQVRRVVGNAQIEERLDIRIEHLKKSRCREDYLKRREAYREARKAALEKGEAVPSLKRVIKGAREAFTLDLGNNEPVKIGFEKYCEVF